MAQILVIDDEPADRHLISHALEKEGHTVSVADSAAKAFEALDDDSIDVVILDILLPDANGLEVYERIHRNDANLPVIFVTAMGSSNTAIEAMRRGAFDYLVKPLQVSELRRLVQRAVKVREMSRTLVAVDAAVDDVDQQEALIGRSGAMHEVYKAIGMVATQNVTVLIRGESGTGKELVARAIYQFSDRADKPFLAVNCAAIPEMLLESELFGHEKGAFTGAERRRIGKFEQSNGGTLFLDEIGDMPPLLQSKLLRVLQEQSFERVGGNETIRTDVRVIAATNRDLESMVAERQFREDLFYRLNEFTIQLPPLRERGDDLALLIEHFRRRANRDLGKDVRGFAPEAMDQLCQYDWPGNVRELQNVIRQAVLKTTGSVILPEFLPDVVTDSSGTPTAGFSREIDVWLDDQLTRARGNAYAQVIERIESRLLELALRRSEGNRQQALSLLGIDADKLRSKSAQEIWHADDRQPQDRAAPAANAEQPPVIRPGMTMEEIERESIRQALKATGGRRVDAAKMLGVSVRTLQRKIKQFELDL